jgi:hypothetical protein
MPEPFRVAPHDKQLVFLRFRKNNEFVMFFDLRKTRAEIYRETRAAFPNAGIYLETVLADGTRIFM